MFTSLRDRRRNNARITQVVTIEAEWPGEVRQQVTTRNQARRSAPKKNKNGYVLGGRDIGRENSRLLKLDRQRRRPRAALPSSPPSESGEIAAQIDPAEFVVKAVRLGGDGVAAYQMADLAGNELDGGRFHTLAEVDCYWSRYREPIHDYHAENRIHFTEDMYRRYRWLV